MTTEPITAKVGQVVLLAEDPSVWVYYHLESMGLGAQDVLLLVPWEVAGRCLKHARRRLGYRARKRWRERFAEDGEVGFLLRREAMPA